jgi:hypothetical protein
MTTTTTNVFREAAANIQTRGWKRGGKRASNPAVCLMDAIWHITGYRTAPEVLLLYDVASEMYPEHFPQQPHSREQMIMRLVRWNDEVCDGGPQAIALLEKTATRLDEQVTP